jgi:hypothetical protein
MLWELEQGRLLGSVVDQAAQPTTQLVVYHACSTTQTALTVPSPSQTIEPPPHQSITLFTMHTLLQALPSPMCLESTLPPPAFRTALAS